MIIKSIPRRGHSFPVKVEEPKKEIPQPVVEEADKEELVNPDDGEGEG